MNHYVLLVLDSCRYDVMQACWDSLTHIPRLGPLHKAYSITSWTLTSHIAFAIGRLPWIETRTAPGAQKTETADLRLWNDKLGVDITSSLREDMDFKGALHRYGYVMSSVAAARPLVESGPFRLFVDHLIHVGSEGETLARILKHLDFSQRSFYILNVHETHYPYFGGEGDEGLPEYYLPGYRAQIDAARNGGRIGLPVFPAGFFKVLFERQSRALHYVDSYIGHLFEVLPPDTFITITADHGDCFGEDGFYGHGEVAHKKVLEVPLIEGHRQTISSGVPQSLR